MQDMIKRIIDADNEAKRLAEKSRADSEKEKEKINQEVREIYDKYMNDAMEIVKRNDIHEEHKAEKQWNEILQKQHSTLIKLKADYEQNRDQWVDAIVSRVIG